MAFAPLPAIKTLIMIALGGASLTKQTMTLGELRCGYCGARGALAWTEDNGRKAHAALPNAFHVELRNTLGRVVICDACNQIMPEPGP